MPVKPENKALYPANWYTEIRPHILERAGHRCEMCGVENYAIHPITGSKVVLTVAHYPDENPANCADDNLLALCQRCHNRLDNPMRMRHAKETRSRKKRAAAQQAGQLELIGDGS